MLEGEKVAGVGAAVWGVLSIRKLEKLRKNVGGTKTRTR